MYWRNGNGQEALLKMSGKTESPLPTIVTKWEKELITTMATFLKNVLYIELGFNWMVFFYIQLPSE